MNATAPLVHLVRAPRSAIVHVSRSGELTACGRDVADTWSSELLETAGALERTTCDRCRAYGWTLPQAPATRTVVAKLDRGRAIVRVDEQPAQLEDLAVDRTPLTLLVVPCSGAKLEQPAPARDLYRGTLTTMGLAACSVVEGSAEHGTGHAGVRTMILSALHGLLDLDTVVAPYDVRMGASESISTAELANQLRATGATRLVALTPNAYTNALRAACELAGVQLVAALEGCRGIGDQRGRLAQLRRSGGYGAGLGLETRRTVQLHADALAEDRARTAAAAAISTDEQLRDRLMAGGASPERAQMVVDARNQLQRELTAAAPAIARALEDEQAQELQHLMDDDLLSLCGARGPRNGYLRVTPVLADVTCPDCRTMIPGWLNQLHGEALREDVAHDAAVSAAEELTPELLARCMDRPHPPQNPMPRQLRSRMRQERTLSLVPPR